MSAATKSISRRCELGVQPLGCPQGSFSVGKLKLELQTQSPTSCRTPNLDGDWETLAYSHFAHSFVHSAGGRRPARAKPFFRTRRGAGHGEPLLPELP